MSPPSTSAVPLRLAAIASCAWLLAACGERPSFVPGDECELNTQCATPLVCRLGHCRVECRDQRDCDPGLQCVRDVSGLGACQLPPETRCARPSDCPPELVCHFGQCANACRTDVDCPPGSQCLEGEDGALGCRDSSTVGCERHSECVDELGEGYVCAVDQRCRPACRVSWDCRDGMVCNTTRMPAVCEWPRDGADAGPMDAGAPDADTDASVSTDGGSGVPTPPAGRMSAGQYSTCAAPMGAPLRCWGGNMEGEVGVGDQTPHTTAVSPVGVSSAEAIAVGQGHACAISGATLYCWGDNRSGQLGLGSTTPDHQLTPLALTTGWTRIDDVALGADHSCAIADGSLYCWGDNANGQLGLGDRTPRYAPTAVTLPAAPVRVSALSVHTCVLLADGTVACFGHNTELQTGSGEASEDVLAPTRVAGITDAVDVAAGSGHTCALRSDGTVWCWGGGSLGRLGLGGRPFDPPPPNRTTPTPTLPIAGTVAQITAGSAHTCAVTTAGELWCWGDNSSAQAGRDYTLENAVTAPALVASLDDVEEAGAGSYHTCVRRTSGEHLCFGDDSVGQLGNGSTGGPTHVPSAVVGL